MLSQISLARIVAICIIHIYIQTCSRPLQASILAKSTKHTEIYVDQSIKYCNSLFPIYVLLDSLLVGYCDYGNFTCRYLKTFSVKYFGQKYLILTSSTSRSVDLFKRCLWVENLKLTSRMKIHKTLTSY